MIHIRARLYQNASHGRLLVLILKRVGAKWLIDCDIWNGDQPSAVAPR
jgi:hypothetical protein